MWIKTVRYHHAPTRATNIPNTDTTQVWTKGRRRGTFIQYRRIKNGVAASENSWAISYKTKYTLSTWFSNSTTLLFTQMNWKLKFTPKTCIWMFTTALFVTAKTWALLIYPSVGNWRNTLWSSQTTKYYLSTKGNELSSHKKAWRILRCILLNEKKPVWKNYIMYNSNDILEEAKLWKRKQLKGQWSPVVQREEGMNGWNTGDFVGAELFCMTP